MVKPAGRKEEVADGEDDDPDLADGEDNDPDLADGEDNDPDLADGEDDDPDLADGEDDDPDLADGDEAPKQEPSSSMVKLLPGRRRLCKASSTKEEVADGEDDDHDLDDSPGLSLEDEGSFTLACPKSSYTLCGKIAKMLYPHQKEGLEWLWSLHTKGKGGILADDMGLGKTMQICSFLAGLFQSDLIKRAMVVAPKTLMPHWTKELATVGLSEMTREYYGNSTKVREYELHRILQDKGVLLTTYDIVRNNTKALKGDIIWDYMILDEAHLIKNPNTQRAKSLREIPSSHRIVISGTPMQNFYKELWALFNFCYPELLGERNLFKQDYEDLILRGADNNASHREKGIASTKLKNFWKLIEPFFLRRDKSKVFDGTTSKLPKKDEIVVWLRLTAVQRQLYENFLNHLRTGFPLQDIQVLTQICDHPLLVTEKAAHIPEGMTQEKAGVDTDDLQTKHDKSSCKLWFIISLLKNSIPEGHHFLIFSQSRKMLNHIQVSLTYHGYKFLRLDGTTKASDRLKIVEEFQSGHVAPILLLTSQVGGVGLTLTAADRVIVVDPAWNPGTDNQIVDRAYRIGQTKAVIVYRLLNSATVEEKKYRKQVFKSGLFKSVIEHKEQIQYFSKQDLGDLLKPPEGGFEVSRTQQQLHEEHYNQIKLDEALESHVKFLGTLGIAGVSYHSLLFSKTAAPVQPIEFVRRRSASDSINDWAKYAYKPKESEETVSSFGANQFDQTDPSERVRKARRQFHQKTIENQTMCLILWC